MEDKWTFDEDVLWYNSCNKCCDDCNLSDKECEQHCLNVFDTDTSALCSGCKYED